MQECELHMSDEFDYGQTRLQGAERDAILADFQRGKSCMLLLLRLKTDYFKKLPWLFCGLAHVSEVVARDIARQIKEAWSLDPRREAHHRITWRLMQPGSSFSMGLDAFIEGASRSSLPVSVQLQIAVFRFPPIVETTIEEKHARVALARRRHHIGPTRVSLSNRMPLLQRWLRKGQVVRINATYPS